MDRTLAITAVPPVTPPLDFISASKRNHSSPFVPPPAPKKSKLPPVPKKVRHPLFRIRLGRLEMIKDIMSPHPYGLATIPEVPDEGPPSDVDPPPLPDYDSGYGSV